MGLIVPDDCGLRVGREIAKWEEGKCLVFDASFEHEAWNRGNSTLFTLVITTFHPDLTDLEVSFLKQVNLSLANSADAAHASKLKNEEKELWGKKWWV
jgi:aspartyl/asparaginyl beta-hydroxylase (cupin superfamily)